MSLSKVTETFNFCRELIAVTSVYLVCNSTLMSSYTVKVCVTDNTDKNTTQDKIEVFFLKDDFFLF